MEHLLKAIFQIILLQAARFLMPCWRYLKLLSLLYLSWVSLKLISLIVFLRSLGQ